MNICITKRYGEKTVLENFTLSLDEGKVTCILGKSGAGKTTLLHCLAGLTAYEGEIEGAPDSLGYVFQEDRLLPHLTVEENLAYVGASEAQIQDALAQMEVSAHAKKYPCALSGGEKQRVSLARAVAKKPALLLLDEPFSSLDLPLKVRLLQTLETLHDAYRPTVVFVTHDIDEALTVGDCVYVIDEGKTVYHSTFSRTAYGENAEERKRIIQAIIGK